MSKDLPDAPAATCAPDLHRSQEDAEIDRLAVADAKDAEIDRLAKADG